MTRSGDPFVRKKEREHFMCRQFSATNFRLITKAGETVDHDGKPYVNQDFSVGSILCTDKYGDVYIWRRASANDVALSAFNSSKPGYHKLFRDYWTHVATKAEIEADPQSPYLRALLASEFKSLQRSAA